MRNTCSFSNSCISLKSGLLAWQETHNAFPKFCSASPLAPLWSEFCPTCSQPYLTNSPTVFTSTLATFPFPRGNHPSILPIRHRWRLPTEAKQFPYANHIHILTSLELHRGLEYCIWQKWSDPHPVGWLCVTIIQLNLRDAVWIRKGNTEIL